MRETTDGVMRRRSDALGMLMGACYALESLLTYAWKLWALGCIASPAVYAVIRC